MDWTLRSYCKRDLRLLARKLSYEDCFSINHIIEFNILILYYDINDRCLINNCIDNISKQNRCQTFGISKKIGKICSKACASNRIIRRDKLCVGVKYNTQNHLEYEPSKCLTLLTFSSLSDMNVDILLIVLLYGQLILCF